MYRFWILIAISSLLLACSGEGAIKIINRTENEIYFSINNQEYTVDGSSDPLNPLSVSIDLDAGSDFPNTPQKVYYLQIEGETFAIYDYNQQIDVPGTDITIEADKTTEVYCDPNYACLRINNLASQNIISACYLKSYYGTMVEFLGDKAILPGESVYKRLEYSLEIPQEPEDIFYYNFEIVMQDSTIYTYGDQNTILYLDDLYEINVTDQ